MSTPQTGFEIRTQYLYYTIQGSSAAQLRAEMNRLGPLDNSGQRYDAITNWWISWVYRYASSSAGCRISAADVRVKLAFKYPRWRRSTDVSSTLARDWNRYLAALSVHEEGHASNALKAGRRILSGLPALAPRSSCTALSVAANTFGQREVASANAADLSYDARTNHGATQGARFP